MAFREGAGVFVGFELGTMERDGCKETDGEDDGDIDGRGVAVVGRNDGFADSDG